MKKLIKKLRTKCGETLIESIAAILIFTFSSIVLLSMIASACKINMNVSKADKAMREELLIAESQEASNGKDGSISISCDEKTDTAAVRVYTAGDDKLYSFMKK